MVRFGVSREARAPLARPRDPWQVSCSWSTVSPQYPGQASFVAVFSVGLCGDLPSWMNSLFSPLAVLTGGRGHEKRRGVHGEVSPLIREWRSSPTSYGILSDVVSVSHSTSFPGSLWPLLEQGGGGGGNCRGGDGLVCGRGELTSEQSHCLSSFPGQAS